MKTNNLSHNLSYDSGLCDDKLLAQTIGAFFDEMSGQYPDHEALVIPYQNVRWTYAELKSRVDVLARALIVAGLEKGERIGIWAPNCAEWALVQFAAAKIGAVLVNINPAYRLHELEYVLNQSECHFLVTADKFKYANYTGMLQELIPELRYSRPGQLHAERVPHLRTIIRLNPDPVPGMLPFLKLLDLAGDADDHVLATHAEQLSCDDPINIQYTSGTTGFPKGATLSHHNILNNARITTRILGFNDRTRLVIPVPLYHCFGMVLGNLGCLTHGATMIYPGAGFDPGAVLKVVEEERATALYGVPTMYIAILSHPDFDTYDLISLRTGMMAGAPCPIEVMKKVQTHMHMKDVQIGYGLTETSPVSTQTRIGTPLDLQVSTVGTVHPWQEIKVVDPESNLTVPRGETGEICMRGYHVMLGYWGDEQRTRETIDEARWIHSGDLGTMDDAGYIRIVGRIKDMIIRGGENIYPREIEEFLHTHPAIQEVQVIGVPDSTYGEEVMAWIKRVPGQSLSEEQIIEYCRNKIAYYKIPKLYKFTDTFPMTVTGKVRKVQMREMAIRELGAKASVT